MKTMVIVSFMLCIIVSSFLISSVHALLGRQDIYEKDKKLVDKYHLIRKEKEQCKSSSSKCKTVKPVDKDEQQLIVNSVQKSTIKSVDEIKAKANIHSRNKTTFRSPSDKPVQSSNNSHANCQSCYWMDYYPNNRISLGLVFLHTRKSGGTNFHGILASWLNHCYSQDMTKTVIQGIERGITNGRLYNLPTEESIGCPHVRFKSIEGECWDIDKIKALPPRHHRNGVPLTLFTILRDPIERIGSQAFYSRNVVGIQTIVRFINQQCPEYLNVRPKDLACLSKAQDAFDSYETCKRMENEHKLTLPYDKQKCGCIFAAHESAIVELKSNASLWMEWFAYSTSQFGWYHNFYKKNYYFWRLFGGSNDLTRPRVNQSFHYALRCLEEQGGCDDRDKPTHDFDAFLELSALSGCAHTLQHPPIVDYDVLTTGKELLRTHIDFIIMEKYGEYSTAGAIASALKGNQTDIARLTRQHVGRGKFISTSSYRYLMPPSIVRYLEQENEWDMELYRHAVQVFQERSSAEGWDQAATARR